MVASTVAAPGPSETFLFAANMTGPRASGDPIELRGCNASWALSGGQVRVDHSTVVISRGGRKVAADRVTVQLDYNDPAHAATLTFP